MQKTDPRYAACKGILWDQLKPAMGCTEPIAIAYAAAVCREVLGCMPEKVTAEVSGNILKNAKAVVVPNTHGRKGIEVACAAGIVAGRAERELEVIAEVSDEERAAVDAYLEGKHITVQIMPESHVFDIRITAEGSNHRAMARIADSHTNIVDVELDGKTIRKGTCSTQTVDDPREEMLNVETLVEFAETCDIEDVTEPLERQLKYNCTIAQEGLLHEWGAAVGRTLLEAGDPEDVRLQARAWAAAGSDARMSGCELPVVINSGSGNQGITVTLPVWIYAKKYRASHERLLRALVISNLVAIHLKTRIGCLSAYCGAISAGCAAGAGISWLRYGSLEEIQHVIVNSVAILSGTICDGAKPSCAAKIACAVDAGILGWEMAQRRREFRSGEGIVIKGVENTIRNVGQLGREGMRGTDEEIMRIMLGKNPEKR